jgi:hypothetical protein
LPRVPDLFSSILGDSPSGGTAVDIESVGRPITGTGADTVGGEPRMTSTPTVSVIIPTYNRAELVHRAIQSVLEQTYADFELIVVDDGSTDGTPAVVNSISDPRIRYTWQPNQGRSSARNKALSLAQGKYVAFLDSDDRFLRQKLEMQMHAMEESAECGMCYSGVIWEDNGGNVISTQRLSNRALAGWIYPELLFLKGTLIMTPTVLIRRGVLDHTGWFDEEMHVCEDLDLWRRVARISRVAVIQDPLAYVRLDTARVLTPSAAAIARSHYYEKAATEDPAVGKLLPALYAEMFFEYGVDAARGRQFGLALSFAKQGFARNPRQFSFLVFSRSPRWFMQAALFSWLVPLLRQVLPEATYAKVKCLYHRAHR